MPFPNDAPRAGGTPGQVAGEVLDGTSAIARPVGAVICDTSDGNALKRSTNAAAPTYQTLTGPAGAPQIISKGQVVMDAQSKTTAVAGVLATDTVLASVDTDDTGAPLQGIQVARASAGNVTVISNAAPTANNGVVKWVVVR